MARASVAAERGDAEALRIGTVTLYVYREGLAQGVPGENHLAWEVEVTDGAGIRDFVYVGAHTGKVIDRISGRARRSVPPRVRRPRTSPSCRRTTRTARTGSRGSVSPPPRRRRTT